MVIQPHRRVRRRPFTLVELLAAMAVLIVIMFVLFRFFSSAEKAWTTTGANTEVFENARVAFDVITRDLQCAVARETDILGNDINFQQAASDKLWFVCAANGTANCDLLEVGYQYNTTTHALERAWETNEGTPLNKWEVYGPRDDAGDQQNGYQKVIDGVLGLGFACVGQDPTVAWPIGTAASDGRPYLPVAVTIQMRLLDRKSFGLWKMMPTGSAQQLALETRLARDFSKTIFLGARN